MDTKAGRDGGPGKHVQTQRCLCPGEGPPGDQPLSWTQWASCPSPDLPVPTSWPLRGDDRCVRPPRLGARPLHTRKGRRSPLGHPGEPRGDSCRQQAGAAEARAPPQVGTVLEADQGVFCFKGESVNLFLNF